LDVGRPDARLVSGGATVLPAATGLRGAPGRRPLSAGSPTASPICVSRPVAASSEKTMTLAVNSPST